MELTEEQKEKLEAIYQSFLNDEKILRMKEISMHRGSNCYEHSFKVAKHAMKIALRGNKKNLNLETLLIGAILHDYYLYDWRKDRSKLKRHTKSHPYIASENASSLTVCQTSGSSSMTRKSTVFLTVLPAVSTAVK